MEVHSIGADSLFGCVEKISQVGMELMLDFELIGGVRMVL